MEVRERDVVKESPISPGEEFAKASAMAQLSDDDFVAPWPLSYDLDKQTVTYERLPVGAPIGRLIGSTNDRSRRDHIGNLVTRAGRALGTVHRHLHLDGLNEVPLAAPVRRFLPEKYRNGLDLEARRQPVVGHGDFSVWNILTPAEIGDDRIMVLDCCPNSYSSFEVANLESRYVDLALMDSCLLGRAGLASYIKLRPAELIDLRRRFVEGYSVTADVDVRPDWIAHLSRAVLAAYFVDRRRWLPTVAATVATTISLRQWRYP